MAKKKTTRVKHQKDDSAVDTSEEEFNFKGKVCLHVARGLNFARVKRTVKATNLLLCSCCTDETKNDELPEVWLCLQCGNRGCGRMSENKHALQHFKTIHSDCHALALSSSSSVVWCYECDDEVQLQQSRNLRQCVEFFMKSTGNKNTTEEKMSSTTNHQSLLETVLKEQTAVKTVDSKSLNKSDPAICNFFVKGLRNLGNTCFFNAVMQNLNQTYLLYAVLEKVSSSDYTWEVPLLSVIDDAIIEDPDDILKIAIRRQAPLATSLLNFYEQMNAPSSSRTTIINPSPLFSEIAKKAPQLRHFQEQDSHELLRQLLDGIRQDEVTRQKRSILRQFHASNVSLSSIDDDTKKLIKAYSCYASHTLVEKIFGGIFISTVLCEECKMSSQVFEPFMDISLPLFEEKQEDNCNQPYLEGGQQQDIKPYRMRKAEVDQNDEFNINKYKQDPGKPSKYQERKIKQLAKKEKKKKNKGRKLSESIEISETEEVSNATIEPDLANNDKESNLMVNDMESVTTDNDEELCPTDNDREIYPTDNDQESCEAVDQKIELKCIEFDNKEKTIDEHKNILLSNNEKAKINCEDYTSNDVNLTVSPEVICYNNPTEMQNVNSKNMPNSFHNKSNTQNSINIYNTVKEENDNIFEYINLFGEDVHFDLKTKNSLENVATKQLDFKKKTKEQFKLEAKSPVIECTTINPPIEALSEDFKNVTISSTETLEPEDRMNALCFQVKGVRIRCDSDGQGSLLESSQSQDDDINLTSTNSHEYTYDNESDDNWSRPLSEKETKEWILKSLQTLKPRLQRSPSECSVDSCLTYFTKPELLTGSNKFQCEKCTKLLIQKTGNKKEIAYSNSSKQLLIYSPPAILTLHLKRFQQVGMSLRKVNRFVEFPSVLDLGPYCSSACQILPHVSTTANEILYSLYGVVEHSGRMSSGHYTAYVKATKRTLNENFMCHLPLAQCDLKQLLQKYSKNSLEKQNSFNSKTPEDYKWYYISDNHVREADEAQVKKCQAYILFYERIK